jgi:hypothetical protein
MALEGTIKDFALPDIFQLIGIQRKTGVLTLQHQGDAVTIKFLQGSVVEADTVSDSLESRLGTVLVRTGRITKKQLDEALGVQRNTLQRLGHILVKRDYISQDELVDALRIQSSQVIYRLFRWREGRYHFDAVEDLDYDQTHSTPISSETILMEGARMVDEWPLIERRIPSDQVVLRKTAAAEEFVATESGLEPVDEPGGAASADDEFEIDFGAELDLPPDGPVPQPRPGQGGAASGSRAPAIKLSSEERQVLEMVDGRRNVREIVDLLALPEFETFRALSEMLTRSLLERVEGESGTGQKAAGRRSLPRLLGWLAQGAIVAAAVGAIVTVPSNRFTPWQLLATAPATDQLRLYAALSRLERIERAVQVFYLDSGVFPDSLPLLAEYGYLDASALTDPWGRPYGFQLSPGGYQLMGHDAAGERIPALTVSRSFSEVQRLLVGGSGSAGP